MSQGNSAFFLMCSQLFKKNGMPRVILNLKELNEHIIHILFKMDSIKYVVYLIQSNCFFMTRDLKNAYFSVPLPQRQKMKISFGKIKLFVFPVLPRELTLASCFFTKLLKPAHFNFRKLGVFVTCYLDDCILIAIAADEMKTNNSYAMQHFLFFRAHN